MSGPQDAAGAAGADPGRERFCAALEELAGFLRAHPDLPVPRSTVPLRPHVSGGSDEEQRAEVDRIAAILGTEAVETAGGEHYQTERRFGPVAYGAVAIRTEHMRRYAEHMQSWHEARREARGEAVAE